MFLRISYEFSNSKEHNVLIYNKLKISMSNLKSTAYKNLSIEYLVTSSKILRHPLPYWDL